MKKVISFLNIRLLIRRIKNNELGINLPLLIILYVILVLISEWLNVFGLNPYKIFQKEAMEYIAIMSITIVKMVCNPIVYYILTPKGFSFKNSISVYIILNIINLLLAFLFMAICACINNINACILLIRILEVLYVITEIYIVFKIKKEYCEFSCKRIYILLILKIVPIIVYMYMLFKAVLVQ